MVTNCQVCNAQFVTYPSRRKNRKGQFCSRACYAKHLSETMRGSAHFMFGKRHSARSLALMRRTMKANAKHGPENPSFKGSWVSRGYRILNVDGLPEEQRTLALQMVSKGHRGIPEHRLMMATKLGRPLLSSEAVHHRNGIKADNRPENLEALDNSTHKMEHKQILAELRALRVENERLKSLLATYQAAG